MVGGLKIQCRRTAEPRKGTLIAGPLGLNSHYDTTSYYTYGIDLT